MSLDDSSKTKDSIELKRLLILILTPIPIAGFYCLAMLGLMAILSMAVEDKPLTPIEARKQVGNKIEIQMKPAIIKDRLERRGEIYTAHIVVIPERFFIGREHEALFRTQFHRMGLPVA